MAEGRLLACFEIDNLLVWGMVHNKLEIIIKEFKQEFIPEPGGLTYIYISQGKGNLINIITCDAFNFYVAKNAATDPYLMVTKEEINKWLELP